MPRTLIEECTVMTTGVGPSALDIEPFDALSFHARHAPHSSTAASRSTLIVEWESESPRPRSLEHTTQANGMRRSALEIKLLDAPSLDEWHARTARTLPHASIAPYLWNGAVRRLVHRLTPARSRPYNHWQSISCLAVGTSEASRQRQHQHRLPTAVAGSVTCALVGSLRGWYNRPALRPGFGFQ